MKSSIALVEDDVGLYGYAQPVVDIYESGTQKYASAIEIYDALGDMCETPEQGILMEMFSDVSEDSQKYHYTDRGSKLKELLDQYTDRGDSMHNMELALWQMDGDDIHCIIFEAMCNDDMAKRIGIKKIVVDTLLRGDKSHYAKFVEEFEAELRELDSFRYDSMVGACGRALAAAVGDPTGWLMHSVINDLYPKFHHAVYDKVAALVLTKEKQLLAECRSLLYSYDDFILGLRHNQALYGHLEAQYKYKVEQLQADYDNRVKLLYAEAERQGVRLAITTGAKEITYIPEES